MSGTPWEVELNVPLEYETQPDESVWLSSVGSIDIERWGYAAAPRVLPPPPPRHPPDPHRCRAPPPPPPPCHLSQTTIEAAEEAKTAAKNRLADYCLTMLRILTLSLSAEKLRDKFEDGDKEQFEAAVQGALDWLKENQRAEKDEFEWKGTQVAGVVIPILHKVYELE